MTSRGNRVDGSPLSTVDIRDPALGAYKPESVFQPFESELIIRQGDIAAGIASQTAIPCAQFVPKISSIPRCAVHARGRENVVRVGISQERDAATIWTENRLP